MSGRNYAEVVAERNKLLGLELLRFVCALAVLLWHYNQFYEMAGAPAFDRSAQPLHILLAPLYDFGLFAVQLFWAVSGFIFFWKYGETIRAGAMDGARFFWLRFSRLYPLHLATLLVVAALQPIHVTLTGHPFIYQANSPANFLVQLAMATHWGPPVALSFNGPIWSVSAEVIVYAAFFLAVRCFGPSWRLIGSVTALSLGSMLAGMTSPFAACAANFFAGGAAALTCGALTARSRRRHLILAALLLAAMIGAAWLTGTLTDRDALPYLLTFAAMPLLFLAAQDWRLLDRWAAAIQGAGNLTYATYLCHFPLQLVLAVLTAAFGLSLPLQSPLFLLAYLGITLSVAHAVFHRFERPMQDWIRGVVLTRRAALA